MEDDLDTGCKEQQVRQQSIRNGVECPNQDPIPMKSIWVVHAVRWFHEAGLGMATYWQKQGDENIDKSNTKHVQVEQYTCIEDRQGN